MIGLEGSDAFPRNDVEHRERARPQLGWTALTVLAKDLDRLARSAAFRQKWTRRLIAIILGAGGAALAGWAQFQAPLAAGEPPTFRVLGVIGVGGVLAAALWGVIVDEDKSDALSKAGEAVREAQAFKVAEYEYQLVIGELLDKQRRLSALHQAFTVMQESIEQGIVAPSGAIATVSGVLENAAFQLRLAMGFEAGESWTLSIFQAQDGPGGVDLVCVTTDRYDRKSPDQVRRWPAGVGHAGAAYVRDLDVIVPDLSDPALGTSGQLPKAQADSGDFRRYRSLAAIPIRIQGDPHPWGVAVATSDEAGRFSTELEEDGYLAVAAVRALSAMAVLAVASQRGAPTARTSTPPPRSAPSVHPRSRWSRLLSFAR